MDKRVYAHSDEHDPFVAKFSFYGKIIILCLWGNICGWEYSGILIIPTSRDSQFDSKYRDTNFRVCKIGKI